MSRQNNKSEPKQCFLPLNFKQKRKPRDYWKDWNNVEHHLRLCIDDVTQIPTSSELGRRNMALLSGMNRYHGGYMKSLAKLELVNENGEQKDMKVWDDVQNELLIIMGNHDGLIPGNTWFINNGYCGLWAAIVRYHGGLTGVRAKLGVAGLKKCHVCGDVKSIDQFKASSHPFIDAITMRTACYSCIGHSTEYDDPRTSDWLMSVYKRTKQYSNKHKLPFDLTAEWIRNRVINGGFKCEITGIPFIPPWATGKRCASPHSLSADRINAYAGYTKDNVRFIIHQLNVALQRSSDEEFELIAKGFMEYRGYVCDKR